MNLLLLITQLCLILCDPKHCNMPDFPVLHHLLELAQTRSLSRWCHPIISLFVVPFSSCLQSCPASVSFLKSQLFATGGQSIEASASTSVPPIDIKDWFPLGLTCLISLQSKKLARVLPHIRVQKHQLFSSQPSLWSNSHIHTWPLEKPYLWLYGPLLAK